MSEQHRHECECRYWLKDTGGDKLKVMDLMVRITKKRGNAAAERLRDGMRAEWLKNKGAAI